MATENLTFSIMPSRRFNRTIKFFAFHFKLIKLRNVIEKVCEIHLLIYYKNTDHKFNLLNKFKLLIRKFNIMTSNPIRPSEIEKVMDLLL